MFTEPLSGWREVAVRERKTKIDWVIEMARLLEGRYARCQKAIVVCDNLKRHTKGAFHEAFEPERARRAAGMRIDDARCKLKSEYPNRKT